jgi:hypothetical protein
MDEKLMYLLIGWVRGLGGLLDARLQELYDLDSLLEALTYLKLFNDLVDDVREYQKMSFGSLTPENRPRLEANLNNALRTAGTMAMMAIKRMTPLLESQQRALPYPPANS